MVSIIGNRTHWCTPTTLSRRAVRLQAVASFHKATQVGNNQIGGC